MKLIRIEEPGCAAVEIDGTPEAEELVFAPLPAPVAELNDLVNQELIPAGHTEMAIVMMRRALAIIPSSPEMWCNLGSFLWKVQRFDEALRALEIARDLKPDLHTTWLNLSLVYESLRCEREAIEALDEAISLDPDYLDAFWNRGLLRLMIGEYTAGFRDYEVRIPRGLGRVFPKYDIPAWNGQDLTGKTLFINLEQGIGDMILSSRFLPWIASKAQKVYMCAQPEVTNLLWEFADLITFLPMGVPLPQADYACFPMSLPHFYGCTLDNLPADPGRITKRVDAAMRTNRIALPEPPGPHALKVGICWSGNPGQERHAERTIPAELLFEIAENPQVWPYSLQAGPAARDITRLGAETLIFDLDQEMRAKGLPSTGTVMQQMDLVITCCTSIAHLAGALGLKAWVLLCYDAYWVWGRGETTPWYPSLKLFRQQTPGDWRDVIDEVKHEITQLTKEKVRHAI